MKAEQKTKMAKTTEKSKQKDKKYVVIREGDVSEVQWKVLRFMYSRFIAVR